MEKDHYQLLEIPGDSGVDQIRRAYLDKVRLVHPDINPSPDAHKEFILLKAAYDVLMNENKRMVYDMKIKQAASAKRNIENFHYDFKSNLSGSSTVPPKNKANASLIVAIIAALAAIIGGIVSFFLTN